MGYVDPNLTSAIAALVGSHGKLAQQGIKILKGAALGPGPMLGASPNTPQTHLTLAHQGSTGAASFGASIAQLLTGGGQQQQQDPSANLYQQLLQQLQTPVNAPTGVDTADLMKQVQAALNPIYDAREAVANKQNTQAQADVHSMYNDLAQNFSDLAPQQVAQSKDEQKQLADLYGQLRSNIEGSYSRVSQEQADEFKQLGIDAALPSVLDKQQAPVQDALTAASQNQASEQKRALDQGQIDSTFYREGAPIAKMQGVEVGNNLLDQLQNYVQQTEADRSSGIQSGYLDQLNSANSRLAQQQQAAASETNQHQQMLWQILQSQLSGSNSAKASPTDQFLGQLPAPIQQSVAGAFTQLQRSPEAVYGKVQDPRSPVPGTFVDTTPDWYMAQADKMLQDGTIDATTHAALLQYMQLYFGAGK